MRSRITSPLNNTLIQIEMPAKRATLPGEILKIKAPAPAHALAIPIITTTNAGNYGRNHMLLTATHKLKCHA